MRELEKRSEGKNGSARPSRNSAQYQNWPAEDTRPDFRFAYCGEPARHESQEDARHNRRPRTDRHTDLAHSNTDDRHR